jgi:hypothetical protein
VSRGGDTQVLPVVDTACGLCGDGEAPALPVPVVTPDGVTRVRSICQACLSAVLGPALQLLGHAPGQAAAVVLGMQADST